MDTTRRLRRTGVCAAGFALVLASAALLPSQAAAQDLEDRCQSSGIPVPECFLALAAVETMQPRIGTALWGGNQVPGTASTLGMRFGSFPRLSFGARATLAPTTLPPLTDRATSETRTAWLTALSAQATVGLLAGFSPLPTVGGVLSLDAVARGSYAPLPRDKGFDDGSVWGWLVGLRVGALRESFTLPGVSLTGTYGRSSRVAFGDPDGMATDGFWDGGVSNLSASLAASKRIGPMGLTAGVTRDRYGSDVRMGYLDPQLGARAVHEGEAVTTRWSGYVNASWTLLVFHGALELGWQETPGFEGLPPGIDLDTAGWWGGFAVRVSI